MFAEIPKIFDRNFIIAFFLPSLVFVSVSLTLLAGFHLVPSLFSIQREEILPAATILSVASWLGGVLLLVLNYSVYQIVEGYGTYNPFHWLKPLEERRYRRIEQSINRLADERLEGARTGEEVEYLNRLEHQEDELYAKRVDEFPEQARLLPTAFGNAVRAFEDYPSDMYGVDSIVVWVRLLGVIPEEYRQLIDTAKAQTDFWVNVWLLGLLAVIEYFCLLIYARDVKMLWFPLLMVLIIYVAASRAKTAAVHWGDYVKASFDLYLPALREKLQLPEPADINEERALWTNFSQVVIYHAADQLMSRVPTKPERKPAQTLRSARM